MKIDHPYQGTELPTTVFIDGPGVPQEWNQGPPGTEYIKRQEYDLLTKEVHRLKRQLGETAGRLQSVLNTRDRF